MGFYARWAGAAGLDLGGVLYESLSSLSEVVLFWQSLASCVCLFFKCFSCAVRVIVMVSAHEVVAHVQGALLMLLMLAVDCASCFRNG